jgi:membrane associated rhomboid family serine protease
VSDEEGREQKLSVSSMLRLGYEFPAISVLILLSSIGFLLGTYAFSQSVIFRFDSSGDGHFWRFITPIFLHFGLMHFAFNMFWLVVLGGKIERGAGSMQLFLLVLVIGALSNIGQNQWSGTSQFGGMSGAIYGLLGYLHAYNKLVKKDLYFLPPELFWFMVGWLIVCASGILEILLGIRIANAAHLCGLMAGSFLGIIFGLFQLDQKPH